MSAHISVPRSSIYASPLDREACGGLSSADAKLRLHNLLIVLMYQASGSFCAALNTGPVYH